MSLLIFISLLFTIIANIILGGMVLLRSYKRPYGWYFALTLVSVALWALGDLILVTAADQELVRAGALLFYIAPTAIPMGILLFSLTYPDNHHLTWRGMGLLSGVFAIWAWLFTFHFDFFVKDIVLLPDQNMPVANMPGFLLYAGHFSLFFLATYYVLYKKYWRFSGVAKTQLSFTLFGTVFASLLAMVTNLTLPISGVADYIWLGPVLTLIFVGMVSYAIIRHQLFDIRLVVARALGYIFTLTVIATVYGLVVFSAAKFIFDLNVSMWPQIFISAATGIAALAFTRLKRFFDRITNRLFFQDAYNPQQLFADLNKVLVSSIDLSFLLKHATDLLADRLKVEYCAVGLKATDSTDQRIIGTRALDYSVSDISKIRAMTPQYPGTVIITEALEAPFEPLKKILEKNNVQALVRLAHASRLQEEGLGYIILGIKKSGNSYNNQDIQVLDTVANELIIAIQNAMHFEEIQKFNVTLQQRINDATSQLRRTNAKLQALDETKDDFISMASHQLRTPLTTIKGYISMVLDGDAGKLTPMQHKMLDQAFISSQRMVFLIADLLNISRLKTGKFVIEPTKVNLGKIVEDEVRQLRETASGRSLELAYDRPTDFPDLMLDETKIRQVIMNFIDNAIYYTPANGRIQVRLIEKPGTIELRVEDNGIGVPKSEQPHLFTKFYRAGNARRARPDGTGLGLFMAKKVIAAQGGIIIFESKEGKGSTFGFIFSKSKIEVKQPPKTINVG